MEEFTNYSPLELVAPTMATATATKLAPTVTQHLMPQPDLSGQSLPAPLHFDLPLQAQMDGLNLLFESVGVSCAKDCKDPPNII